MDKIAQMYGLNNLQYQVELGRCEYDSNDQKTILDILQQSKYYPDVQVILKIVIALPATSVEHKRFFSTMNE